MLPFLRKQRTILLWLLVALTDVAVAIPWMLLLHRGVTTGDWYEAIPGVWLLLLVFAAASLWEAGDRGDRENAARKRVLMMALGALGTYMLAYFTLPSHLQTGVLGANRAMTMIPVAAYLWYQGASAVADGLDYSRIFSRFPMQVVLTCAAVVLLVLLRAAFDPGVAVLLYWSVLLFIGAGLTAMLVAREDSLRAGQARLGLTGPGKGDTSPVVTGIVVALLALTLGASYMLSVERMSAMAGTLGNALSATYHWLTSVAWLVISKWVYLFALVIEPAARWLFNRPRKPQEQEAPQGELGEGDLQPEVYQIAEPPAWLQPLITTLFILALAGLGAWLVYRMTKKPRERREAIDEERISLGFWDNLLADLKGLMNRQPGEQGAPEAAPPAEALDPRDPRALYRRLQTWGALLGRPRGESETPSAYQMALVRHEPEREGAVSAVTAVYNQAKYGATPPSQESLERAVAEAEQLKP